MFEFFNCKNIIVTLLLLLLSLNSNSAYVPPLHSFVRVGGHQRNNNIRVNIYQMISMGDVRSNIEHVSRLLDENKVLMSWILAKKKQIYTGKYANGSVSEHRRLNERFNNLTKREVELHIELQKLLVIALEQQLGK